LACLERRSYGEPALLKSGVEPGEGGQMPGKKYLTNANTTKEGFTGKERDKHSGLDYFGARFYDNKIGKFISVDPHSFNYKSLTSYNYVGNNPLNFIDPTGMDSIWQTGPNDFEMETTTVTPDENVIYIFYSRNQKTKNDENEKLENEDIINTLGIGINISGLYTGTKEYQMIRGGLWKGKNGRWYKISWPGNKQAGSRIKLLTKYKGFRLASKIMFAAGITLSVKSFFVCKNMKGYAAHS
jgi:RHS repeat-associated protein